MKRSINFLILMTMSFLFLGCVQKINIKAIQSSKIDDKSIRYIGVAPFGKDSVSQSDQIESSLDKIIFNNTKYFNLVDRKNIDKIMKEKRLNDSGLVDLIQDDSSTGLSQIQTLITGKIMVNELSSKRYYEERTDYKSCVKSYRKNGKTYCSKYRTYNVSCRANLYTLKTYIKIIKISDAKTIFANSYQEDQKYTHCSDDSDMLPSKINVNTKSAKSIAQRLVLDIAPSYTYYEVELIDDEDVDLNDNQEKLFENALEMIKINRISKANKMLDTLNRQLQGKSYVVLYDLAVTFEALGDVDKSYQLLQLSEDIALQSDGVVDEIARAIVRVQKSINEKNRANKQF
jgi:hypothetical protein